MVRRTDMTDNAGSVTATMPMDDLPVNVLAPLLSLHATCRAYGGTGLYLRSLSPAEREAASIRLRRLRIKISRWINVVEGGVEEKGGR